ncbi:MAG: hypothetical protein QHH13_08095 [Melioribacter sp.]|nr:hypothetical protein [Melioribacter sp.]
MGNLLNRSQLLEREELQIEKVEFEDGNFVYVRQMTGHERDLFEQSLLKKNRDAKGNIIGYEQATEDFRAKLAVVTICDEKGNLILQPTDYLLLSKSMSAKKLEKIINVAQKLNAITEEDKENILKNLEAVQDGNSNSDSV